MSVSKKMVEFAERSSWIRKMFEEGAKMKAEFGVENVFDFSLGNPDLLPPSQFQDVLNKVVAEEGPGVHSYMPNGGYPYVRDAVAAQMSTEQGVTLSGVELLLTCGAAGGLNVVMKSLLDLGDEVIILNPFFVEYKFYVDNHGGITKVVETDSEFDLDLAAIEEALTKKTKAFIINSPNNPTGQIYSAASLSALGDLLEATGNRFGTIIYLVADEPYRKIVFDNHEVPSIMQAYTNSLVVSSYSKDLSLPGERIGYVAVHPEVAHKQMLLDAMILANRILGFVNAPALMQRIIGELQGVMVDSSVYTKRRDTFCAVLENAGFEFIPPKGAFYIFPKSPLEDEVEFVAILKDNKILAVPGRGFGSPGYFRLAFCVEDSVIEGSAAAFVKATETAKVR